MQYSERPQGYFKKLCCFSYSADATYYCICLWARWVMILRLNRIIWSSISRMVVVGSFVQCSLIAEEKEKNTLRGLMLSPASTLEILGGKSLLSLIATMTIVVIGADIIRLPTRSCFCYSNRNPVQFFVFHWFGDASWLAC